MDHLLSLSKLWKGRRLEKDYLIAMKSGFMCANCTMCPFSELGINKHAQTRSVQKRAAPSHVRHAWQLRMFLWKKPQVPSSVRCQMQRVRHVGTASAPVHRCKRYTHRSHLRLDFRLKEWERHGVKSCKMPQEWVPAVTKGCPEHPLT